MNRPLHVAVAGHRLLCHHCRHDSFRQETATLDRFPIGFLSLGGVFGHHATAYACVRCGYAHLFFSSGAEHATEPAPEGNEDAR